jgi:hypothetical protein
LREGEDGGVGRELGKAKEMLEEEQQEQEKEMIVLKAVPTTTAEHACDAVSQTQTPTMEMLEGNNGNPDEEQQTESPATTAAATSAAVAAFALASPPPVMAAAVALPAWAPFSAEGMPEVLDVIKGAEEGGKEGGGEEDDAVSIERSVLMSCSSDEEGVPETEGNFDDDAVGSMYHDQEEEREARVGRERESLDEGGLASPTHSGNSLSNDATVAQDQEQEQKERGKEGVVSTTPPSSKDSTSTTEQAVDEKTRGSDRRRSSSSSSSFSRPSPRRAPASTTAPKARSTRSRSRSVSRSRSRSISSRSSGSSSSRSRSRSVSRGKDGGQKEQKEKKRSSYASSNGGSSSSSRKEGYRPFEEKLKKTYDDDVETIEILNATLIKLLELDGSMSPDRGFYPDDLRVKLSLSPRLWEEIYDGAGIVPNRSNRLYRSRVRRLVWYVEARLGLPCSLKPLRAEEGGRGGGMLERRGGGRGGRREEEERVGHYGWGKEGGREERDRERRGGGRRGEERERVPAAVAVSSSSAASAAAAAEVVEEQMECEEPTPFVAIKNLSRCGFFLGFDSHLTLPSSISPFVAGVVAS